MGIGLCRRLLVRQFALGMCSYKFSYEDAVQKLNSLQSNKASLEQIRREMKNEKACTNIQKMEKYLARTGVSLSKLDELSVIHVAGTKGKGSTSAMCESILRHHGFKTGFYSSPHLVEVRERIRLEGLVIDKHKFAEYFQDVYTKLDSTKAHEGDMPQYFCFMTVLAYNIFLKERVDVAIVEVGIGGIVDYTNILRKVPVVGITALGLDHTSLLGNTLAQIARAKAGIMKPGCLAYTVSQPPEAMEVLREVADDVECPLTVVPKFETYEFSNGYKSELPADLEAYQTNASLAIQLSHAWISRVQSSANKIARSIRQSGFAEIVDDDKLYAMEVVKRVPEETAEGLKNFKWPGRYQIIKDNNATFFLDGAHTKESIEICVKWFEENNRCQNKILIFSATGDRDVQVLLTPLKKVDFKSIYFVIPTATKVTSNSSDNYSIFEKRDLLSKCNNHANIWRKMQNGNTNALAVRECVLDAFDSIKGTEKSNCSVLITGSLHLVGAALSMLDPNLIRC